MTCRVCGSAQLTLMSVAEMMLGTREEFAYELCNQCGSLQIKDRLSFEELSKYYQPDYWSSGGTDALRFLPIQKLLFKTITMKRLHSSSWTATFSQFAPSLAISKALALGISIDDRVLDVGCGAGAFISQMAEIGIAEATGIDPFVPLDVRHKNGARIYKRDLSDYAGVVDVITFHHSLEHVYDPVQTLSLAAARLDSDGRCLVRIPTPSSEAFATYREKWVQLDAPRHFTLPSRDGMAIIADRAGFELEAIVDDSTAFQFWGSEQYLRNIPLKSPNSEFMGRGDQFTADELRAYSRRARSANRRGRGDQAIFFLRKRGNKITAQTQSDQPTRSAFAASRN